MTDSKALARPAQVTVASWVAIVGSVFVVMYAFSLVANLRTLDTREQVEDTLSRPPGSWLDLGVEGYLDELHVAAMVAAGCAVATAILGWHVRSRNRSARIALTVLAVPLFIAGAFTDGFMSSMVAFSAVFLWLKPSRDWFNGVAPTPAAREAAAAPWPPSSPDAPAQTGPAGTPPPPAPAYGQRPAFTNVRPREVVVACILTWVFAGLVLVGSAFLVMGLLIAPDTVKDAYQDSAQADDISFSTLRQSVLVAGSLFAVWSIGAIAVAVFAMLGRNWARITLLASSAMAAGLFLLSAPSSGYLLLVPMLACVHTVMVLLRRHVVEWYTRRL